MARSDRFVMSGFTRTRGILVLLVLLASVSTAWLVSGCSTVLGADFDRPAASADGGGDLPTDVVTNVPEPEPPNPDGSCAEGRKLCGRSCVSPLDARFGCGGSSCEACAAPPHGVGVVCTNGGCGFTCENGYEPHGATCVDPIAHDTWATVADMPTARWGLAAVAGADGRIYAIGGNDGASELATVEVYAPSTDTWTTVASMPTARSRLAAVAGEDGRIYAVGGTFFSSNQWVPLSTVEAYTPSTNTWATVAKMSTRRNGLAAVAGADGRIYAIGGDNGAYELSTVEVYTPSSNTWTNVASMSTARDRLAAAVGPDGRIFAIGGRNGDMGALSTFEAYVPSTDSWSMLQSMPAKQLGLAAAVGPDGRIFAIENSVTAYTPGTNSWAVVASTPTKRTDLAAARSSKRIYAIGGHDGWAAMSTVEAYTP